MEAICGSYLTARLLLKCLEVRANNPEMKTSWKQSSETPGLLGKQLIVPVAGGRTRFGAKL